jgi:hypothetical protein
MYKLLKDNVTNQVCAILKDGSTSIPICEDNTDYQQYLKWVEEGNTPLPADEGAA